MIRIRKPAEPPAVLRTRGLAETVRCKAAYEANSAAYEAGTAKLSFDDGIYGHSAVKESLVLAQHGKCAFCEAKLTHVAYGDVEHFRPKGGYRQHGADPLGRPGYYWLAYEWSNLYLSCQLCNQRFKKNAFPLADAGQRCRNHLGDLAGEDPQFIDPGAEDPEAHIEFAAEQPKARNGSLRGEVTIEALGLRRERLRENRFERYRMLLALKDVALLYPEEPWGREAKGILDRAVQDDAEYAAMARCLIGRT